LIHVAFIRHECKLNYSKPTHHIHSHIFKLAGSFLPCFSLLQPSYRLLFYPRPLHDLMITTHDSRLTTHEHTNMRYGAFLLISRPLWSPPRTEIPELSVAQCFLLFPFPKWCLFPLFALFFNICIAGVCEIGLVGDEIWGRFWVLCFACSQSCVPFFTLGTRLLCWRRYQMACISRGVLFRARIIHWPKPSFTTACLQM
jgi:hypothetical protein